MASSTLNKRKTGFTGTSWQQALQVFVSSVSQYTDPQPVTVESPGTAWINGAPEQPMQYVITYATIANDANIVGLFPGIQSQFPDVQVITDMVSTTYAF